MEGVSLNSKKILKVEVEKVKERSACVWKFPLLAVLLSIFGNIIKAKVIHRV